MENGRDALASGAGEGIRVLVVDEDPIHLETMTQTLSRCGYQGTSSALSSLQFHLSALASNIYTGDLTLLGRAVTTKASPAEALREVQENPDGIDLVLTVAHTRDGIDGFTLLQQARDHYPVILFSGDATAETVRRGFIEGACDFLTKPLHDDVMRNICHHVNPRRLNTTPTAVPMNTDSHSNHIVHRDDKSGKRPLEMDDSNEGGSEGRITNGIKFHWTAHKHALFHRATNRLNETKDYTPRNMRELIMEDNSENATTDQDIIHLQKNKGDCSTDWLSTMPTIPTHYTNSLNDYPKSQYSEGTFEFNIGSEGAINLNQTSQLSNIATPVGYGFHGNDGSTTSLCGGALRGPASNANNGHGYTDGNGAHVGVLANGSMVSASQPSNLARTAQQPMPTLNLFPSNTMLAMDNPNHIRQQELLPQLYPLIYDCSIGGIRMLTPPLDDGEDLLRSYLGESEDMQNTATTDMAHGMQNAATMDITLGITNSATVEMTQEISGDGAAGQTGAMQLQGPGSEFFSRDSTTVETDVISGAGGLGTDEMMHRINMDEFNKFLSEKV
ncbi:hypothetical protein VPH35_114440 [Triticum aestivum]